MRLRAMRVLGMVVIAAVLVSGCGSAGEPEPGDEPGHVAGSVSASPTPVAGMPTRIPAADGEVQTSGLVLVMDTGRPELCAGPVATSLPPQCGGPPIVNWDWEKQGQGMYESSGKLRWGSFWLAGTFDGTSFTVTETIPAPLYDARADFDEPDFATPCPEPEGGWRVLDPAKATDDSMDAVFAAAGRLPGYANAWMDRSRIPADAPEERANDPALVTVNVQVTGDVAPAERALRKIWGGALCVTRAEHTEAELQTIQHTLMRLPGIMTASSGRDRVEATVLYDDGSLQRWADATYGKGLVEVSSALLPAPASG